MKKYLIMQCLCLGCNWFWEVVSTKFNTKKEQCPNCKGFSVKTALKLPIVSEEA